MSSAAAVTAARAQFSRKAAVLNLKPLWERAIRPGPKTAAVPALWRWAEVRPFLMRGTELISVREAVRRVLMLENPALPGTTFIATTLFAGLQTILPGEISPTHRHTPNALRFIIEGEGAYTAMDGERVAMRPGDFVMTPGWTWHDHGNSGPGPVVWLDGLDTAFANMLGANFREDYPEDTEPVTRPEGNAAARYGANLLPVDCCAAGRASPILSYPYEPTREALAHLARSGPPDPWHGYRMRYANPANGGHLFPTMAAFMQFLPDGFAGRDYRSTASTVFCVVEGRGNVAIGETRFDFAPHDVFVVPSWEPYRIDAQGDCVLFSYSDLEAQERLGFWREQT
jgi:gentisate 1,2-dioxygenase